MALKKLRKVRKTHLKTVREELFLKSNEFKKLQKMKTGTKVLIVERPINQKLADEMKALRERSRARLRAS